MRKTKKESENVIIVTMMSGKTHIITGDPTELLKNMAYSNNSIEIKTVDKRKLLIMPNGIESIEVV